MSHASRPFFFPFEFPCRGSSEPSTRGIHRVAFSRRSPLCNLGPSRGLGLRVVHKGALAQDREADLDKLRFVHCSKRFPRQPATAGSCAIRSGAAFARRFRTRSTPQAPATLHNFLGSYSRPGTVGERRSSTAVRKAKNAATGDRSLTVDAVVQPRRAPAGVQPLQLA
jgi:hypothetical protein